MKTWVPRGWIARSLRIQCPLNLPGSTLRSNLFSKNALYSTVLHYLLLWLCWLWFWSKDCLHFVRLTSWFSNNFYWTFSKSNLFYHDPHVLSLANVSTCSSTFPVHILVQLVDFQIRNLWNCLHVFMFADDAVHILIWQYANAALWPSG